MSALFLLLILLGPALLLGVGLLPSSWANCRARLVSRLAAAAAWIGCAALLAAALMHWAGPATATSWTVLPPTLGALSGLLSFYFDALTALMALLVSFIAALVIGYSRNYLDGDARHGSFIKWMSITAAAVLILVCSGNLALFAAAWIATSLSLHQLLVFYRERPAAVLAARKKFFASRIGDLALIAAAVLTLQTFGSLHFAEIFAQAANLEAQTAPAGVHAIVALLVISAVFKSAQFPFHGWLPEVMETPTPVSALLHAGIVNAGGFLLVRMSEVVSLSAPSLTALTLIGAVTALFGALVMITQTSIKVSLAYSTVAQMGFMLLQCGLGAFSAAALHIVAHSLYKAHAFLSSGSVVDLARAAWLPPAAQRATLGTAHLLLGAVAAPALTLLMGIALGFAQQPGVLVLGAVLMLGLSGFLLSAVTGKPSTAVVLRAAGAAVGVSAAYFVLQAGAVALLSDAVVPDAAVVGTQGWLAYALAGLVIAAFVAAALLQALLPQRLNEPRWQKLYVALFNGLYVNAYFNRLLRSSKRSATSPMTQGAL